MMLAEEPKFIAELEAVAHTITRNYHLHKELVAEAHVHILELELDEPSQARSWYLWSCHKGMLNYLEKASSLDVRKRRHRACPLHDMDGSSDWTPEGLISKECVLAAVAAADLVSVVSKRLRPRERYILEALAKG